MNKSELNILATKSDARSRVRNLKFIKRSNYTEVVGENGTSIQRLYSVVYQRDAEILMQLFKLVYHTGLYDGERKIKDEILDKIICPGSGGEYEQSRN